MDVDRGSRRQEAYHRKNVKLIQEYGAFGMNQPYVKLGLIEFWRGTGMAPRERWSARSRWRRTTSGSEAPSERDCSSPPIGRHKRHERLRGSPLAFPVPGVPARTGVWEMFVRVVEALAVLGELDEASRLYPTARELAARGAALLFFGETLVQKVAGIAAAAGERWEEAEEHFEAALRHADEIPVRIEQPEVRRWYAWFLTRRDRGHDGAKADRLLSEALERYETIGMPRHAEWARQSKLSLGSVNERARHRNCRIPRPITRACARHGSGAWADGR